MSDVRFHPNRYAEMAERQGWDVDWHTAVLCPCTVESGQASATCPVCLGWGWAYPGDPVRGKVTMSAPNLKEESKDVGRFEEGDQIAVISSRVMDTSRTPYRFRDNPLYKFGDHDTFTLLRAKMRVSDILTRGSMDDLRFRYPAGILQISVINDGAMEEVPAAGYKLVESEAGYENHVEWIGADPAIGQQYSVLYEAAPVYYAYIEMAGSRVHANIEQVKRWQLRLLLPHATQEQAEQVTEGFKW